MSEPTDRFALIDALDKLYEEDVFMGWPEADRLARASGWDFDAGPDGPDAHGSVPGWMR